MLVRLDQEIIKVKNQQDLTPIVEKIGKREQPNEKRRLGDYLVSKFEFRYNVLTGMTEYREIEQNEEIFQVLNERERNTLFLSIKEKGIRCTFSELLRYLDSSYIKEYHPFRKYLQDLPDWDHCDRISELASRVSNHPIWIKGFHRWMLGLTAQWMGLNGIHANSVAPILISTQQGMMKSTFCKSLIPNCLQDYYTDQIELSAQGNFEKKMALMGLINMDEFDRIPAHRMAQLKNLMQTTTLTIRQAYRKNLRQLPRIASFIGTSNRQDILTDPSGNRRFLCVEVKQKIDCAKIDIHQIYAQLKAELMAGERYWFTSEEEQEIQEHNATFRQVRPEEELLQRRYRAPLPEEKYEMLSLIEIVEELRTNNNHLLQRCDFRQFGIFLQAIGLEKIHTRSGNRYKIVRIQ